MDAATEKRSIAWPGETLRRRLIGSLIGGAAASLLLVAASLEPAAAGVGTHLQLGLPSCGWITTLEVPCLTCGMTTSFAHAAGGDLLASFRAQPFGFLLAVATACAAMVGGYVALTGSRVGQVVPQLWSPRAGWITLALLLLAWGYKIIAHRGSL